MTLFDGLNVGSTTRNDALGLIRTCWRSGALGYWLKHHLIKYSQHHLALAQKLEEAVSLRLEHASELSENALRNLAVVSEAAQRISRLALGASTENVHTDPYSQMTDAELASELGRLGIEPTPTDMRSKVNAAGWLDA